MEIYLQDKSINFESKGKSTKDRMDFKSKHKFYHYMILCSMIEEVRMNVQLLNVQNNVCPSVYIKTLKLLKRFL